jgi:hypothetical protein
MLPNNGPRWQNFGIFSTVTAIRFPNQGNRKFSFDSLKPLGVASSSSSHFGSSRIFFLYLSRVRARCTQVPRGAFAGVVVS